MTPSAKNALRSRFRIERLRIVPEVEPLIQGRALTLLPPLLSTRGRLGLYWPLMGEVDLRCLAQTLGDRLALPAVVQADGAPEGPSRLIYRPWEPDQALVADGCGIPAPAALIPALDASELALLLVPALAVDRRGYRLGSGGGWYDRLRSDPTWARLPALVVLPSACLVDLLPSDSWDIPFAGWLSEEGLHWI